MTSQRTRARGVSASRPTISAPCSEWRASSCATSIRRARCGCWACGWPGSTRTSSVWLRLVSSSCRSSGGQGLIAIEVAARAHRLAVPHDPDDVDDRLHRYPASPALGVEPRAGNHALPRVDQLGGLPAEVAPDLPRVLQVIAKARMSAVRAQTHGGLVDGPDVDRRIEELEDRLLPARLERFIAAADEVDVLGRHAPSIATGRRAAQGDAPP